MSLVAKLLPKNKRAMGVSMHSLIRRIPMALGPLIGGVFIATWGEITGVRLAFIAALALAIVAAILQQTMIPSGEVTSGETLGKSPDKNPLKLLRQFRPELKRLLISDMLIRFCEQIPYAFVVLWCMKEIASPVTAVQFGVLTTVEMATAVLVYIPVAYFSDKAEKKPFVVMTFVFFTLFPLLLLFSQTLLGSGRSVRPSRTQGIWRADTQSADHRFGRSGPRSRNLRYLLSLSRFSGCRRRVWWFASVANQPGDEFSCGDSVWIDRDNLVCLVAQSRKGILRAGFRNCAGLALLLTIHARLYSYLLSGHSTTITHP